MDFKEALFMMLQATFVFVTEGNLVARSSYFQTRENKQLLGYAFKRFNSASVLSCGQECLRSPSCSSTNFKFFSKKEEEGTCELNKHDVTAVHESNNFDYQEGAIFSIFLKGCLLASCLNGGSCLPDKEKRTFSCSCKLPWTGDRCESELLTSCKEIHNKKLSSSNKAHLLKVESAEVAVYCHMTNLGACGGGGWTLVMKMNGTQSTFRYNSDLWSNNETFNLEGGKTGFDLHETKLPTYWGTPFSKICLGMKIGHQINFTVINKQASSLHSLIADGNHRNTSLGRETWKELIGSQAFLQPNCNKEGFNVVTENNNTKWPKVRIGILSNNEDNCFSCDSRIGFGAESSMDVRNNSCGNEASISYGDTHIKTMGYILVQ